MRRRLRCRKRGRPGRPRSNSLLAGGAAAGPNRLPQCMSRWGVGDWDGAIAWSRVEHGRRAARSCHRLWAVAPAHGGKAGGETAVVLHGGVCGRGGTVRGRSRRVAAGGWRRQHRDKRRCGAGGRYASCVGRAEGAGGACREPVAEANGVLAGGGREPPGRRGGGASSGGLRHNRRRLAGAGRSSIGRVIGERQRAWWAEAAVSCARGTGCGSAKCGSTAVPVQVTLRRGVAPGVGLASCKRPREWLSGAAAEPR